MTRSKPSITGTTHTLPFDKLSPRDFERLCLWLIVREGYERAEHLGAAGIDQGRDIVAWRDGEQWVFQCKLRWQFTLEDIRGEIEKVLTLSEPERPAKLVFLVTCDVSTATRQRARECCAGKMACHFWATTELNEKVKHHPDVVEEFFGTTYLCWLGTSLVHSPPPIIQTTHILPFERLSPIDFERLCFWLVEREGFENAQHLGAMGSEQGRDIIAVHEGKLWAFQCKRVRRLNPTTALIEVDKILALPKDDRPVALVFLVTCNVSGATRQKAKDRCAGEMECYFWAATELDERVKRYTDILDEFFGYRQRDPVYPTPPPISTRDVLPFDRKLAQDLQDLCLELFIEEGFSFLQMRPIGAARETHDYLIAHTGKQDPERELWIFEWLGQAPIDRASTILNQADEVQSLCSTYSLLDKVFGIQFIHGGMIPAPIRNEVLAYCAKAGLHVRFWGLTELDELAKRHPGITEGHFDLGQLHVIEEQDQREPKSLTHRLALCQDIALSSYEKGRALEGLAMTLFEPCFIVDPNLGAETGEIDLWLERQDETLFWTDYGVFAVAECKNRSDDYPVKSAEVSVLIDKCRERSVKLGFFVSLGPFGKPALTKIRDQNVRRQGLVDPFIVPVRRRDIEELAKSSESIEEEGKEEVIAERIREWLRMLAKAARQDRKGFYNYGYKRRKREGG